ERAVKRLEKGKDLTERDVARIVRNEAVTDYLAERSGVEIHEETASSDAIEALKALASQREASQGAQAENVSQTEETAPTGESEARPEFGRGLNYTRSAEDTARAMTEMAQPMSPAESIRMQTGEEARAARFEDLAFRKYSKVADALERLNVDSDSAAEIVQAYQPGQNEVEYAGEAARFINQGEEGRDFDYEAAGENPTMSLAQARVAYTAGRAKYNTNINEEAENGTEAETGEVRVRDGLQGNDGAGTGVEAGRVERGTGSAEFREEIAGFRGGRRVSGVRSESVSASDLGIRNGTTRKNIRILQKNSKGVYADKYIEQAREEVEARGYMYVPFVGGSLEIESISKNGKKVIVQSRGYFDPETKTIYVRADHQIFTADQIARHELMHETLSREYNDSSREEVLSKYRDRMIEDLGSVDKLEDVLRDYYALYKGTELSNEDVFEEMICDAAGNMNEFIMHGHMEDAAKAAPVLKAAKKATVSARTEGGKDNNSSAPKYSAELKAPASFTLSKDTAEETEKNIQSGKSALNELIEKAKTSDSPESLSVKNAMSRKELGNIDFVWGNPGKGASFKHGYGFSHIISKRNSEGGDGVRTAYEIVNVIANATNGDVQKNDFSGMGNKRIRLYDNGYTVVLSQNSGANSWVLSGWENEQTDASASGEVRDSSGATAAKPIRTRLSGGNASVSSVDTVAEENPGVKKKNSRDLGVYLQETHEEYKTDKENLTIAEQGIEDLLDGLERISAAGGEVDLGRQGRDGKTDIRTLGNGISAQFIKTGRVNLNGTKIRNAEDLAQLCQIFRNPRFETVRYFYVKKGKIVGTDSVTCRLPGLSLTYREDFQSNDLIKKIKRVGADGVYLMHNHPSGHVNPSTDDINATGTIAETVQKNTGAKLLGHIIIDHRVFTELQADTKNRTVSKEEKEIPGQMQLDFLLMPSQENRNLGKDVYSPETVAAVGRDIVSGKGYSAIVYASQKGQVRQIQEVSDKALLNNKQLVNYIRNQRVNIGAGMAFVYTQNDDVYKAMGNAYVNDILTDVILDGPEMLLDMRSGTRQREGMYMGLNVSLKDAVHANEEQSPYSDVESKYDRYLMPDSDLTQEEIKAKKDYRTYLMPEAKEWYSKSARFKNWAHRDLAYISAASVAGAKIPYEILKTIPEIVKAEERARGSKGDSWSKNLPGTNAEVDARRDRLVEKLLDDEHGSAAWDEGKNKIKKVNGKEQFTGPVARNREAYIVIGRPAGGKSRVFANPLSHEHQARIIDSDVVKPWLDGFDDGYGAGYVQKESAKIADKALQMAIARGENVVIPRVGGKSVISDVVETLKEYGYTVNLYYNEVSEDSSIMRAASRFAEEGRFLSLDYLTTIGNKADKTFRDYAENKDYFDYAEWRNNDVEFGKEPTETWNSRMEQTIRERLADQGLYGDRRRGNEQRGNAEGNREDSEGASRTAELKTSRELSTGELYEANRQLRKDLTELRSKLKTRTEQRDYWKGQTKVTDGRRVRLDDAKTLARVIASEYGTKVDADVVGAKMKDLAEFCLNEREFDDEFYGEARTKAYEIAHIILDNAEILREEGDPASYEKLRDYLRTTKLYVPGNMQHDLAEDYQAFRKSLLGTVTLTTSDTSATGIDQAYKELQGIFGEGLFPDINHPADQLKRVLEILESFRPIYERMNNYEMADAVEWTANDILGR
ncbi:MAG: zeta toxin family protein, partial [Clostridia bacterium]|nr:zeta toxin family protein [Clostridia bacterium]